MEQIEIAVRFTVPGIEFVTTRFGYGGSNYARCCRDNEKNAFHIADTELSNKYECEVEFGQIPKIYYY